MHGDVQYGGEVDLVEQYVAGVVGGYHCSPCWDLPPADTSCSSAGILMKYQFFVSNLWPDTYLMTAVIMTLMKRSNSPGIPFSDIPPPETELEGLDVLGLRLSVSR